jgi:amidase
MSNASAHQPSLSRLGLLEVLREFRDGRLSRNEYLAACRERALAIDATVHAFAVIADLPKEPPAGGPLAGIPIGLKDLFDTADMATTYGSALYAGHRPSQDAALARALRSLGATIIGKTVTTEFAWKAPGPTRNPWALAHTPGGSSSGSAAAVAAEAVPIAIGTQTFGSVIRPAAYCGVVGFKPSSGVLPLSGAHPLSPTLDHAGLFARSIDDVAYLFSLLAGLPAVEADQISVTAPDVDLDRGLAPSPPPRLRLIRTAIWHQVSEEQQRAVESAADAFRSAGATVDEIELPSEFDQSWSIAGTILATEANGIFGTLVRNQGDRISDHLRELVQEGAQMSAGAHVDALLERDRLRLAFRQLARGFDAVLTVPALGTAPAFAEGTGSPAACTMWTLLGAPSATLNWTRGSNSLPLGIQLVGDLRDDGHLLAVARWCEALRSD